ncbi:hypothetical protein SEA_DUMPTRUCK_85 [Gordonia phage DumpTruck]|nr:hypothetical protein SEA_DUMPTRUCK_85 [Gordonia phage DumpTruck]
MIKRNYRPRVVSFSDMSGELVLVDANKITMIYTDEETLVTKVWMDNGCFILIKEDAVSEVCKLWIEGARR